MTQDLQFSTKVSGRRDGELEIRGRKLEKLIVESDFVSVLFLSITGREATPAEVKLLNAILVSSIDHGIEPASGFVPRVVASSGNSALTAMASALLALGPYHGGAITPAMGFFTTITEQNSGDLEASILEIIRDLRASKKRILGFGHPIYKDFDPRSQELLLLARQLDFETKFIDIALTTETLLEQEVGKKLVLNIDGAIATLLLTMDFPSEVGDAIFGLARVAGSIAHIVEEKRSGKVVRRLPVGSVEYEP